MNNKIKRIWTYWTQEWRFLLIGFLGLSMIAAFRNMIIGLDIDEEYAVALAYRLAAGDIMVKEMWEPHQTSVFIPALLIKVFLWCKPDAEYLILFLRGCGFFMAAFVAGAWYMVFRRKFGQTGAALTALIILNTMPKWMSTPEFANQQIWYLLLLILCLYQYAEYGRGRFLGLAAIFMVFEVLAYPSCILLFPFYFIWVYRRNRKHAWIFASICGICAGIFVGYLLFHMSFDEVMECIRWILADPSHSEGLGVKMLAYGRDLFRILGCAAVYTGIAAIITGIVLKVIPQKYEKYKITLFCSVLVVISWIYQVWFWGTKAGPIVYMEYPYLILFILGSVFFACKRKVMSEEVRNLFSLTIFPSLFVLIGVLLLTNLNIKSALVHLLPGILCTLLVFCTGRSETVCEKKEAIPFKKYAGIFLTALWLLLVTASRIMLVRENEGLPMDVFLVKQKALYGAAKYIYCPYMTGYQYNDDYLFLQEQIEETDRLLYIGRNPAIYMITKGEICGASTISTPVFDERYIEYFSINPDKWPTVIVIDKTFAKANLKETDMIVKWIEDYFDTEDVLETEFLYLVR